MHSCSKFISVKRILNLKGCPHSLQVIGETKDINNFKKDKNFASYSGQAPNISQSASVTKMRKKRAYNRHLAKTIHNIACVNIRKGERFHEEYLRNKKLFKSKLGAMKPIKRKIVRLLFYKLKDYSYELNKKYA